MLETKLFEIRDRLTFIPVLAVNCQGLQNSSTPEENYLLRRAGYGSENICILLTYLSGGGKSYCEDYDWADRTMATAHHHIVENWHELQSGDVIDVEFILGESTFKKVSERYE